MLDQSLPYAVVSGISGISYEQAGKFYDLHGREMILGAGDVASPAPDAVHTHTDDHDTSDAPRFRDMSDDELRAALAVYGEPWAGRRNAIRYLKQPMGDS